MLDGRRRWHAFRYGLTARLSRPVRQYVRKRRFKELRWYADALHSRLKAVREAAQAGYAKEQELILAVRPFERRLAFVSFGRERTTQRWRLLLRALWTGLLAAVCLASSMNLGLTVENVEVGAVILGLVAAWLLYRGLYRIVRRAYRTSLLPLMWPRGPGVSAFLLSVSYVALAYGLMSFDLDISKWFVWFAQIALLSAAAHSFYHLSRLLVNDIVYYLWYWEGLRRAPEVFLVYNLVNVIVATVNHPERWREIQFRSGRLRELEVAAKCFEYYVPYSIRTYDAETDSWKMEQGKLIAGALRKAKMEVLLAPPNARERLLERMMKTLASVVFGRVEELERLEPQELKTPVLDVVSPRRRILRSAAAVLKGVIPLGIALVVTQVTFGGSTQPLVTGSIASYIVGGSVIYAIVTIVMTFDPQLAARVSIAREIINILPSTTAERGGDSGTRAPDQPT